MKTSVKHLLLAAMLATAGMPAQAADPAPPQQIGARQIDAKQRCPVCGMYPARYPGWAAQIVFGDNTMTALESPAELFRFLRNIGKYDSKHTAADIAGIHVTDHAQRTWIDAKQAFYVQGSKAKGPMGSDLPAFAGKPAAEAFAKESGGKVMTFDALASAGADHGAHEHHHH